MAYPTYQPQIPYQQPMPAPMPVQAASPDGRRWVQGEIGALSYYVTDNNVVTLWDSTDPEIFYEKSTDVYGKPILKKYRRTEVPLASNGGTEAPEPGQYVTQKEHDGLKKDYEALKRRIMKLEKRRRAEDEYDGYDNEDQ